MHISGAVYIHTHYYYSYYYTHIDTTPTTTHTLTRVPCMHISGAVIVGSVDGNRLWGKELKMQLKFCEWSPGKL